MTPSGVLEQSNFLRRYLTPIDVFPVSLSMIHAAGLGEFLSDETVRKLKHIESDLQENVSVSAVLQAPTDGELLSRFQEALASAAGYYIQSGVAVWQDLGLDYAKLVELTRVSCRLIEGQFFEHRKRLSRPIFVISVASLRVMREVGRLVTEEQEDTSPGNPPMDYLEHAIFSTFIIWCLLVYLRGNVKGVRRNNVKELAEALFSTSREAYREAAERGLFKSEAKASFWSPDWQKGEVEADLDERDGEVKSFSSAEDLIEDLHSA
jgi:hypothetical protein